LLSHIFKLFQIPKKSPKTVKSSDLGTSVFNSGPTFKNQVSGSWKKKPGKTRFFSRFWSECDFEQWNSISLWNYYCWSLHNLLANY